MEIISLPVILKSTCSVSDNSFLNVVKVGTCSVLQEITCVFIHDNINIKNMKL